MYFYIFQKYKNYSRNNYVYKFSRCLVRHLDVLLSQFCIGFPIINDGKHQHVCKITQISRFGEVPYVRRDK